MTDTTEIIKSVKERCGIKIDDREASEISKHVNPSSSNLCEVARRVVKKRIDGSACKVSDAKDVKYFSTEAEANRECGTIEKKSGVQCASKFDKKCGRYYVAVSPQNPKRFDSKCDMTELYDYFPLVGEHGMTGRGRYKSELFDVVTKRLFYEHIPYIRKQVVEDGQIVGIELIICIGE